MNHKHNDTINGNTTNTTLLSQSLTSQNLPTPSPSFLTSILTPSSNSQRLPPLPALIATAKHRLLSSSLTTPSLLSPTTASFPHDITNVHITSRALTTDIFVQVLDIDDLGTSKWDQIESLESERKGETTKGREVIRVLPTPAEGDAGSSASTQIFPSTAAAAVASNFALVSRGPFKLLLQDQSGQQVYGFELKKVDKISYPPGMSIGCKILLRKGCKVARGMVLLEPGTTLVLGGKIEGTDKVWREGREEVLRERVEREREEWR